MDKMVELRNVESVCRLCLSTDGPKSSIFNVDDSSVSLVVKIQACLSIQISSNDRLPALICARCIKNVNQWHAYKESCLRSQNKLQQWLANQTLPEQPLVTVKQEPMDLEYDEDNDTVVIESDDSTKLNGTDLTSCINDVEMVSRDEHHPIELLINQTPEKEIEDPSVPTSPPTLVRESERSSSLNKSFCMVQVKSEPLASDGNDCNLEIESVGNSELLFNPLAVGVNQEDRIMEADSTQKSNPTMSPSKKKVRRGPHTHFRGARVFKQKCSYCQIHLHSKYSYMKHMERFHSSKENVTKEHGRLKAISSAEQNSSTESVPPSQNTRSSRSSDSFYDEDVFRGESQDENDYDDVEEMIEDVEDEIDIMEKDAPLSQVQQDIISQLKTFSCYSCQQVFHDRRSTLNHIRQHMPDLRPYTCIACLTEFADRSIYKSHCGSSFECAMKIALVEPKVGCEKYFTCNMCLRPMVNRKELLSHLSKHSDKQYAKLISPMRSPPKLKPMVPLSTVRNETVMKTSDALNILGPYENGNPSFNHVCDLCGMIYRYKPNMFKHRELCRRLPPEVRTSYKCIHCGMTFLVFKKFHTHLTVEHKKREFTCSNCNAKFKSPSDYLTHHERHKKTAAKNEANSTFSDGDQSSSKNNKTFNEEAIAPNKSKINYQKYSCSLCGQEFPSKYKLSEHKNLHLKVKIYSCVICRSMFSNSGALEIHMKDHGIEDPNERNANSSCVEYAGTNGTRVMTEPNMQFDANSSRLDIKCQSCDRGFANMANLKRHVRNIHEAREYFKCAECVKTFKSQVLLDQHTKTEHKPPRPTLQCPHCPKTFVVQANLNLHVQNIHARESNNKIECDICGKTFLEEQSLKTHRGWHYRANCRLSLSNLDRKRRQTVPLVSEASTVKSTKPARARKSFPNAPPKLSGNLKCQVCDDSFLDVVELRNHLWDVHCARNKPEKSIVVEDFQCELCTNVFPDDKSLELHLQWHKENPILSNIQKKSYANPALKPFHCETCGNRYSTKKSLYRHRKLHRATTVASIKFQSLAKKPLATQFQCNYCRRVFDTNSKLREHKTRHHFNLQTQMNRSMNQPSNFKCEPCDKYYSSIVSLRFHLKKTCPYRSQNQEEPRPKKPRLQLKNEIEDFAELPSTMSSSNNKNTLNGRKPVTCKVCDKMFLGMSQLYKHKQEAHNTRSNKYTSKLECIPILEQDGNVSCNICGKQFASASNVKLHFGIVHKSMRTYACQICKMSFTTASALKSHSTSHSSMIYSCNLCICFVFTRGAMTKHMLSAHKRLYQSGGNRKEALYTETDLSRFVVKGATGTVCPICKIKYPNIKAMKIHYFKFHY